MSEKSAIQVSLLGCFTIGFGVAVGYVCGREIAQAIFNCCCDEFCTGPSKDKKSLAPKVTAESADHPDQTDSPNGAGLPVALHDNQMPESLMQHVKRQQNESQT